MAFVELLKKSGLDYASARKPCKLTSKNEDICVATVIDAKSKKLQVLAFLDLADSSSVWSYFLDERAFQLHQRLLDITELSETMSFLAEQVREGAFDVSKSATANPEGVYESSQLNVTFTNAKNKQSVTIQLQELHDDHAKFLHVSKILWHTFKQADGIAKENKAMKQRVAELTTQIQRLQNRPSMVVGRGGGGGGGGGQGSGINAGYNGGDMIHDLGGRHNMQDSHKVNMMKPAERAQMSLVNPTAKKRPPKRGVDFDNDDSD